jgi:small subunit ribosomal protein S13
MAIRIAGINLPNDKRIIIALTYIYGVGNNRAQEVLKQAKINPDTKVDKLKEDEINKLREVLEKKYLLEGDLRREVNSHIKRLKEIDSYRGSRHLKKLPVHGQRTKTNARTKRGKKQTMGSGKNKASAQKT